MALGSDIIMVLDECIEAPADRARAAEASLRTLGWARRSRDYFAAQGDAGAANAFWHRARRHACRSAPRKRRRAFAADFPGYAIGGLAVGEPHNVTCEMAGEVAAKLPHDRPRYLMGVGKPEQIPDYVGLGVDMMDCVLPTRSARHGCLFTSQGRVLIKNAQYAKDSRPLDETARARFAGAIRGLTCAIFILRMKCWLRS